MIPATRSILKHKAGIYLLASGLDLHNLSGVGANLLAFLADAMLAKLGRVLQIPSEDEFNETAAIVDMGVDSLVAVEIRSWFLQELDLDMSVLKILGGSSVKDLLDDAMPRIPPAIFERNNVAIPADSLSSSGLVHDVTSGKLSIEATAVTSSSTQASNEQASGVTTLPSDPVSVEASDFQQKVS